MTKHFSVFYLLPSSPLLEPANYEWQEPLPVVPSAAQAKVLCDYQEQTYELQYRSLSSAMAPSKVEIAITAKQFRLGLSDQVNSAIEVSNRPDTIPADMSILKGNTVLGLASSEAWRTAAYATPRSKITHILPMSADTPIYSGKHQPKPLPAYSVPQRPITASEKAVAEWLAQDRQIKPMGRSSRLARLQARFWNAGDGKAGLQPIDARNAELRSLRVAAQ